MLRTHIQQLSNTNFIFAGSERHMLQQMFADSARPFYNSASFLELNAIDREEYINFATRMFAERDKHIETEAIESVYDNVDGNTFYIQKALNISFSMTALNGRCTKDTTDDALREMLASYDTIYRESLSSVNEPQKQLLLAIAQDKNATQITSASFIKRHALTSASSVQAATRQLVVSGLITRTSNTTSHSSKSISTNSAATSPNTSTPSISYTIQDPLLRLWLLQTY